MAKKILIVYLVYTVIIFLFNSYIFKENYADAILKAVLSGVVFTALFAVFIMRKQKQREEAAKPTTPAKKKRKNN